MKDFAFACLGDQAVRVAETSCAGGGNRSIIINNVMQNCVTCYYRTTLSTCQELLTMINWTRRSNDVLGSVVIGDNPSMLKPNGSNCQLLRKKKSSRSFVACNKVFSLYYDLSEVKYGSGSEPIKDFYVILIADAKFCLLLGDMCSEFIQKCDHGVPIAKFFMFSRKVQVLNTTLYSTKARFQEGGKDYDISIKCQGDASDFKDSELHISIDQKRLISVKRLQWNFRGNQTIFVEEGSAVDVMWDAHDWWFRDASRSAFFMFRTRSTLESRLWSVEETAQSTSGFSLLIQIYKS